MSHPSDTYAQLLDSQESLEFALQSGRMGTWDINLDTHEIQCSKAMLDIWGIQIEHFQFKRSLLQSKVHPDDVGEMNRAIDDAIKHNMIYEHEFRIYPTPENLKWVRSRGRLTGKRFSGVVYDITEMKIKQDALDRAVKARDNFFMIASHELRTPLTCLELQLQVMEWDLKNSPLDELTPAKLISGLEKQREHLARITRIVDNILDESRINRGHMTMTTESFDLSDMVLHIVDEFKIAAESVGVSVSVDTEDKIVGKWDRFKIEQVLLNLLSNALRYGDKKPIRIRTYKDAGHAFFCVQDEGLGIKIEDQERIFERFERVAEENGVKGFGLGLFISNSVVKAHGGEIHVKSEPGKGSTFIVALPL